MKSRAAGKKCKGEEVLKGRSGLMTNDLKAKTICVRSSAQQVASEENEA